MTSVRSILFLLLEPTAILPILTLLPYQQIKQEVM